MDHTFWKSITDNDYAVPDGHSADDLALELLPFLASPNPDERDGFGYMILAHWMVKLDLTPEGMRPLLDQLRPMLQDGLGEKDTDTVFGRSFASVIIWQILNEDKKRPFLDESVIRSLLPDAVKYLREERDLRGYVPEKGWAHSTAHGADFLWGLAQSEHTGADGLAQIMDVIAEVITRQSGVVYIHHEEQRLTRPVGAVLRRDVLGLDHFDGWLDRLRAVTQLGDPEAGFDPGIHSAYTNTKNLLRSIYVQLCFVRDSMPNAGHLDERLLDSLKGFEF